MAENLNYKVSGSKCYELNPYDCDKYGRLYNLEAATKACPSGWHLPSNAEWEALRATGIDEETAGKYFKVKGGNGIGDYFSQIDKYGFWWSSNDSGNNYAYYMDTDYNFDDAYWHDYNNEYSYSVRCVQDTNPQMTNNPFAFACEQKNTRIKEWQKDTFTDTRDGKVYKTVKYKTVKPGGLVWLAENLNYEAEGSKCYNDSTAYCDKYGKLYDWYMAMRACPEGWHLPSDEEWDVLIAAGGGVETAGKYLKAVSGWNWNSYKEKSGNGNDKYGFSALPGGYFYINVGFVDVGEIGYWWSSTESSSRSTFIMDINYETDYAIYRYSSKNSFHSVRCVQDNGELK